MKPFNPTVTLSTPVTPSSQCLPEAPVVNFGHVVVHFHMVARVYRRPFVIDAIVQVGTRGAAGITQVANHVAALDLGTVFHRQLRHVGVEGFVAVAVLDGYRVAIAAMVGGPFHHTVRRGKNGRTVGGHKVRAFMGPPMGNPSG